jgi:hypothetical protein
MSAGTRSCRTAWMRGGVTAALALCLLGSAPSWALDAVGYGANQGEARQRAAIELVNQIQVRVQSVVESCTQTVGRKAEDCGARVLRRTVSDLPLLGLRYEPISGGAEGYGAKAVLDPKVAGPLFRRKLAELHADFAAASQALDTAKDARQRYELLGRQLVTLRSIFDHGLVAVALGESVTEAPGNESSLLSLRTRLELSVDSIPMAARVLLKDLEGSLAGVGAMAVAGSREVTDFGAAMSKALLSEGVGRPGTVYVGQGEYRVLDNGQVEIALELRQQSDAKLVTVRTVRLLPEGYAGLEVKPTTPDFERLLQQGVVVSGNLKVDITTARGSANLLFTEGETIRLLVRANQPVYLYVVGNVVHGSQRFSYLLPLQGNPSDAIDVADWPRQPDRFIKYLSPTYVDHHVEIGEFEVVAPFGTEHLQVFSSPRRFELSQLPGVRYQRLTGYFLIDGSADNIGATVNRTRGLAVKRRDQAKVEVAEGTLTFTTKPR